MDNPPSYGNYDDSANVLHTSNWTTLSIDERSHFEQVAKNIGGATTGESYFEYSVHRWVFIHEMGHWWRACQHLEANSYQSEMAADRLDIAYWRARDPAYAAYMKNRFSNYLNTIPNPVPTGADAEKFLNDNYGKLPIPAYIWYQSRMIVDGFDEKPVQAFKVIVQKGGSK